MSDLIELYPLNPAALAIEQLLSTARKKIEDIVLADLSLRRRATPDWESLSFVHASEPSVTFLFVVARNTKENTDALETLYSKSTHFPVVRDAKKMIWTDIRFPRDPKTRFFERRFNSTWPIYVELIAVIGDIGHAVIHCPASLKLFIPSTYRRHNRKHSKRAAT